jgi:hypothetical protein
MLNWFTYIVPWALKGKISLIKTSQLMMYREMIAVCSEMQNKLQYYSVWAGRRIVEC